MTALKGIDPEIKSAVLEPVIETLNTPQADWQVDT